MRVEAFVCNWQGHEAEAAALEEAIRPWCNVTVINSEEGLEDTRPAWVHLDDTAYFSAQWNAAVSRFDADVLLHVQADAGFRDFGSLIRRARAVFAAHPAGIFAPVVERAIQFDRSRLRCLGADLYEVPATDNTCWFLKGDIARAMPRVDPAVNKYGWGIPVTASAIGRQRGLVCVADHSFIVRHAAGTGYDMEEARLQRFDYMNQLDPALAATMVLIYSEIDRLRCEEPGMQNLGH